MRQGKEIGARSEFALAPKGPPDNRTEGQAIDNGEDDQVTRCYGIGAALQR
jgi:hypothetical protein